MEAQHGITCKCGENFQNPENLTKHVQLEGLELLSDYEPRRPNKEELEDITEWYVNNYGLDYPEAVGTVNQCYYIIIDSYVTGSPGYAGKLLVEIGSSGPGFYTVYTWTDGQIQRRNQAQELQNNRERGE